MTQKAGGKRCNYFDQKVHIKLYKKVKLNYQNNVPCQVLAQSIVEQWHTICTIYIDIIF